jgi:hypothetical protein
MWRSHDKTQVFVQKRIATCKRIAYRVMSTALVLREQPAGNWAVPGLRLERLSPFPAVLLRMLNQPPHAPPPLPSPAYSPLVTPQPTPHRPPEPPQPHSTPIDHRPRTKRLPSSRCIRIARTQPRRCQQSNAGDPDTTLGLSRNFGIREFPVTWERPARAAVWSFLLHMCAGKFRPCMSWITALKLASDLRVKPLPKPG